MRTAEGQADLGSAMRSGSILVSFGSFGCCLLLLAGSLSGERLPLYPKGELEQEPVVEFMSVILL